MNIDTDLVRRLEELARIELSPEERARTEKDLQDILGYMDTLSGVDLDGVRTDGLPGERVNIFRDDVSVPSPGPDVLLSDAPETKENQFKAPKTFE